MTQFIPKDEWELHDFTTDCACEPVSVFKGPDWDMAVLFGETIYVHQRFSPLPKTADEDELSPFLAVTDAKSKVI